MTGENVLGAINNASKLLMAGMDRLRIRAREAMDKGHGWAFFLCPAEMMDPGENAGARVLRDACLKTGEPWVEICSINQILSGFGKNTDHIDAIREVLEAPLAEGRVRVCVYDGHLAITDVLIEPMVTPTKGVMS